MLDKNDSNVNADDGYVMNLGFYDDLGYSYTAKFAVKPIKQNGTVVAGKYQITLTDVINSESKSILDANEATKKTQIQSIFGTDGYKIEYDTNKGTFVSIGANGTQKPVSQLLKMSALNTGYTTDLGNGQTQKSNASGLEKVGNNCYQTTLNSGEFDGIGVAVDADGSSIDSGELEMSNVDLSGQFTDMIVTQRGFQANSRVITTSDTLLEELINLKR